MKYFILSGEASGDKQAALLSKALFIHDPDAHLQGWGGDDMIAQGVYVTKHYRDLAFMGFVEVIRHLPAIARNFSDCKKEVLAFRPDALILVDYPGFNLRIATWAHRQNIPVYYYISPQLWAWHTSRVNRIKETVRKMYVILPFEKEFYASHGVDVMYIGHPLAMSIKNEEYSPVPLRKNHIALLPGSRKHEIELILPEMVSLAKLLPEFFFHVVAVGHIPYDIYKNIVRDQANIHIEGGQLHRVLRECEAAIVTSGTATLETALIGTPQIVVYKGNPFSYQLARRLIKVPFISLVNLIAGRQIVPELIQSDCNAVKLKKSLKDILDAKRYEEIKMGYDELTLALLDGGGPDAAAADIISDLHLHKTA